MKLKTIILSVIVILSLNILASAADTTPPPNSDPFSPGSAKAAYDESSDDFKSNFNYLMGIFWIVIAAFIIACFGMATASHAARDSGQFADPEKKAGGAKGMLGIIFVVLLLFLAIAFVKPLFGF